MVKKDNFFVSVPLSDMEESLLDLMKSYAELKTVWMTGTVE